MTPINDEVLVKYGIDNSWICETKNNKFKVDLPPELVNGKIVYTVHLENKKIYDISLKDSSTGLDIYSTVMAIDNVVSKIKSTKCNVTYEHIDKAFKAVEEKLHVQCFWQIQEDTLHYKCIYKNICFSNCLSLSIYNTNESLMYTLNKLIAASIDIINGITSRFNSCLKQPYEL